MPQMSPYIWTMVFLMSSLIYIMFSWSDLTFNYNNNYKIKK